ncbi:MAG: ATP-binding protein, partial [Candidatus Cloacimonetes bacterium]|nr:ATP-binding protein [Candidatus Cloacimonadota bacterium]
ISPKDLKSIMRGRYQQKEKNKKNSGIGLGIHLCQTSLKLMNAKLQIESNPGLGTKITVFLPV